MRRVPDDPAGPDDGGNVSVLVTAVMVVAILLCGAMARLGGSVAQKARANNAADAAALAAAGGLALGRSPVEACSVARHTASDNGARLVTCDCLASAVEVTVAIGEAEARSRADVDALEIREVHNAPNSGDRAAKEATSKMTPDLSNHTAHSGDFRHDVPKMKT
jgi:secretion/DNA translocation related TadE-like protein